MRRMPPKPMIHHHESPSFHFSEHVDVWILTAFHVHLNTIPTLTNKACICLCVFAGAKLVQSQQSLLRFCVL